MRHINRLADAADAFLDRALFALCMSPFVWSVCLLVKALA